MTRAEAEFREWCEHRKAERKAEQAIRRAARRLRMVGMRVRDRLPMARVWLHGPKWKRAFDVQRLPVAEVAPAAAKYHREGKQFWWYDFADDVRELACERVRFNVYAQWSDPWEHWGNQMSARRKAERRG